MATDLYEVLGVPRDAPPEEVRRAYKKRALETHPDRAVGDKEHATEEFRKLSNAYEVLSDPVKRRDYDTAGVWPPPQPQNEWPGGPPEQSHRHYQHHHHAPSFNDIPRGYSHRDRGHHREWERPWPQEDVFMDPFRLFEQTFADLFNDPFFSGPIHRHRSPHATRSLDPFSGFPSLIRPFPPLGMGMGMGVGFPDFGNVQPSGNYRSRSMAAQVISSNGRWASESRMTRTVNGVTESVWQRKDVDGNEYSTYTGQDGREKTYINGVEQGPRAVRHHSPTHTDAPPIPPPVPPPPQRDLSHDQRYGPPTNQFTRPTLSPPPPYTPPPPRERRERRHSQEASSPHSRSSNRKWY